MRGYGIYVEYVVKSTVCEKIRLFVNQNFIWRIHTLPLSQKTKKT